MLKLKIIMNICIIGDGLTGLSLAKNLVNKKINVHFYHKNKTGNSSSNRTIGISKNNLEFFKKEIDTIDSKKLWEINKIEIYSEKLGEESLLNFEQDKNNLFYMVKNDDLHKILQNKTSKNKYFEQKIIENELFYEELLKKNAYYLIINCDSNNFISKKYFTKRINKDYNNLAYTTILKHKKIANNIATQIFTKNGPIAFLPISHNETSVVCSLDTRDKRYKDSEVLELIRKNNPKYKIKKIHKLASFKLSSSKLRNYHYKNILAFGDVLHRVHPLAGQGFNMTMRDIKILSKIIQNKIELGIQLDSSILVNFEKETKNKNFLFSSSIDFIYEAFNIDKKTTNKIFNKILQVAGKNKSLTNYFIKLADRGLSF